MHHQWCIKTILFEFYLGWKRNIDPLQLDLHIQTCPKSIIHKADSQQRIAVMQHTPSKQLLIPLWNTLEY